ncbi:RNA-directed DNA polymerase (Reverse transcriptase) [Trifolium medium]|uniref:RNA-directed DNA polymerase (Reverse transcriptase) n=1 Tax=Trifolium medium TaxID=97028 RepID=A0A392MPR9_9FABA|nr:RNA-directed DNA polymerase (Reverse transcriptase) [Trifolium medium]
MIKSVLQAIPTYVMSIYLLPDSLINDIERMINTFWWGGGNNNKGIRWLAWDKMACPKEDGGLGFRDFQMFNMAMVAKQGWNLINKPNSLVARIFKARWCIGDGSNIKVMGEPWLREEDGRWVTSPQIQEKEANMILAVPLLHMVEEDKLIWSEESNGIYSVRSGYRKLMEEKRLMNRPRERDGWGSLWKIQAPPKVKHLYWRICKECLPTRTRLRNRHVHCPIECPLCQADPEE